jgi:type I restriction enzyme R subunit
MIVCMSRRICVDLYNAIIKIRPQWASAPEDDLDSERTATCVAKIVMTGSAADGPEWQPHVRSKLRRRKLANRFKDPKDPFSIVIVRDMWLTGFDAPCLHTMYVDKPMQGHGLMQAIARVNRVFKDKPGGLIVDYLGLADQLKQALATYTESGGKGKPTDTTAQAIAKMLEKYEVTCSMLHGFDWSAWANGTGMRRLALLPAAQEHILQQHDGKQRFIQLVSDLSRLFSLCSASDEATKMRFLAEIRNLKHKNVAAELLARLLKDEIKQRSRKNVVQSQLFSEQLRTTLNGYHNRAIATQEVIEELIKLAKDLDAATKRGENLGLNDEEIAFYDALATNDSAKKAMGDDKLKVIAAELIQQVRKSVTIDWQYREGARAKIRVLVKRILNRHGYPPDLQDEAVQIVLKQAELLCADWV